MATNPIHMINADVDHINLRIYFPKDALSREESLEMIHDAINASQDLANVMISAYELVSDGFGRLVPDVEPLA